MTQYIDKNVVVAEIEDKIKKYTLRGEESDFLQDGNAKYWGGVLSCLNEIHSYLNTLEIKEVDFETAFAASIDHFDEKNNYGRWPESDLRQFAEHIFELGLKASNVLTWEDMKQIRDIMVECSAIGLWSKPDEEYYQEVVKRFKAQKGK